MKFVVIKYLTIIGAIIFMMSAEGHAAFSMESMVQKLQQIGKNSQIEDSGKNQGASDIFLRTIDNYKASQASSIVQSIVGIKTNLQQQANKQGLSCPVEDSDILTLLSNSQEFMSNLYNSSNISLSQSIELQGDIKNACAHVLSCVGQLSPGQKITDNSRQINQCQTIVQKAYQTNKQLNNTFKDLPLVNNNDNIYMDNIKDNGLFDIMIDIENIKKVLFNSEISGPSAPQMIYYALPSTHTPITLSSPGSPSSPQKKNSISDSSTSDEVLNPYRGTSSTKTTKKEPNNPPLGESDTNDKSLSSDITAFLSTTNSQLSTLENPSSSPATTQITQPLCLPGDGGQQSSIFNEERPDQEDNSKEITDSYDAIEELSRIQQEILDSLTGGIYIPSRGENQEGVSFNIGQNYIQFSGKPLEAPSSCTASCTNEESLGKLICEGKCCLANCNQIKNAKDRAVCLSQCVCGEASAANDLLRIKICRVPVQTSVPVAGKTIHSVEEGIEEISKIFTKLQNNGALIKRTKKKEFLDSSFSSIKFKDIVGFNIFVATKPIVNTLQYESVKKQSQDDYKKISSLNTTDGARGNGKDKNKYSVSGLHGTQEQKIKECELNGQVYDAASGTCKALITNSDIISKLSQVQFINTTNDGLGDFLSQHYRFREELYNQFSEFGVISTNMRIKADQAH